MATSVRCDVADENEVTSAVQACVTAYGGLDMLVNNAGITRDATLRTMTTEQFDAVIDTDLRGTWLGTHAAVNVMREQKSGFMVNMSSISGTSAWVGQTNCSAAKAGMAWPRLRRRSWPTSASG